MMAAQICFIGPSRIFTVSQIDRLLLPGLRNRPGSSIIRPESVFHTAASNMEEPISAAPIHAEIADESKETSSEVLGKGKHKQDDGDAEGALPTKRRKTTTGAAPKPKQKAKAKAKTATVAKGAKAKPKGQAKAKAKPQATAKAPAKPKASAKAKSKQKAKAKAVAGKRIQKAKTKASESAAAAGKDRSKRPMSLHEFGGDLQAINWKPVKMAKLKILPKDPPGVQCLKRLLGKWSKEKIELLCQRWRQLLRFPHFSQCTGSNVSKAFKVSLERLLNEMADTKDKEMFVETYKCEQEAFKHRCASFAIWMS